MDKILFAEVRLLNISIFMVDVAFIIRFTTFHPQPFPFHLINFTFVESKILCFINSKPVSHEIQIISS